MTDCSPNAPAACQPKPKSKKKPSRRKSPTPSTKEKLAAALAEQATKPTTPAAKKPTKPAAKKTAAKQKTAKTAAAKKPAAKKPAAAKKTAAKKPAAKKPKKPKLPSWHYTTHRNDRYRYREVEGAFVVERHKNGKWATAPVSAARAIHTKSESVCALAARILPTCTNKSKAARLKPSPAQKQAMRAFLGL